LLWNKQTTSETTPFFNNTTVWLNCLYKGIIPRYDLTPSEPVDFPLRPVQVTFLVSLCTTTTHQPIERGNCSNRLKMWEHMFFHRCFWTRNARKPIGL